MTARIEATWRCRFGGAKWRIHRWRGLDTGWRQLPQVLLEAPRGGRWRVETDSGVRVVEPGATLIVGGGVRHRMVAEVEVDARMVTSWVFVDWEAGGWPLRVKEGVVVKTGRALAAKVEKLARAAEQAGWADQAARAGVAFTLLADLAETFEPSAAPDERVAKAMRHAREHLAEPLRRADLAKVAGVSEAHLQDLFARATGRPPMEYVVGLRIRRAMDLLAAGGLPVGEVARACGFASAYYFSRFFRKTTGQSPRAYRDERKSRA